MPPATATVKADRWTGLDDFRLYWAADTDALGLRVLAYRATDKEDGYFMLLGNPAGAAAERAVLKDVLFVMDTSGSMRGEKIEQARAAQLERGQINRYLEADDWRESKAARRLVAGGHEVVVLEARDRVGGRTEGGRLADGTPVELGGQWIGPTQDRMYELVEELGLEWFRTHPA